MPPLPADPVKPSTVAIIPGSENLVVYADILTIAGTLSNAGRQGSRPPNGTDPSRHGTSAKSIKIVARKLVCATASCTIATQGENVCVAGRPALSPFARNRAHAWQNSAVPSTQAPSELHAAVRLLCWYALPKFLHLAATHQPCQHSKPLLSCCSAGGQGFDWTTMSTTPQADHGFGTEPGSGKGNDGADGERAGRFALVAAEIVRGV